MGLWFRACSDASSCSLSSAQREQPGVRVRGGIFREQLHGAGVGQIQRLVFGFQSKGETQKRLEDHTDAAGSAFHETPPQG